MRIISFIKIICFAAFCLTATSSLAQKSTSIWTIDFVKVKNNQLDSAVLALEKNWGAARIYAQKLRFVKSHKLLIGNPSLSKQQEFDLLLITEYADLSSYQKREANFKIVFDKYLPDWIYVNGKKPKDYTEIKFDMVFEGSLPLHLVK